ncbi:UNVERIFIED_CONTAM: hypothetical protein Sradi_6894300 [Sesamum radiatum]|uniref:Reverse transcriptase domain-containing protein n=1 Tax=Sesamum radiatum TaxID=300843 RepID=A0AAW2JJB7_SESRA
MPWLSLYEIGGVEVVGWEQFVHCRLGNKRTSSTCLISVVYGDCDPIRRRLLWGELLTLSSAIVDSPWCALGDFNIVIDESESRGGSAEVSYAMAEFREFILDAGLIHLPYTGCPFTWHNCSTGSRSLWRRLDRALVNDIWLDRWPQSSYLSALPQTSDHSPLLLLGAERRPIGGVFRFENFLISQPGFLNSVKHVWRHHIHGNGLYGVTRKLKALKPVFRAQRKAKGDLAQNVWLAKEFLEKAQALFDEYKADDLQLLVQWCRKVYSRAVAMEDTMLRQRAKLRWLKDGDRCSKAFFRKINATRAKMRVFQITNAAGDVLTEADQVANEFLSYYETLLGGVRHNRYLNLDFLQPYLKHTLSPEEAAELILPISSGEIKEAFFDISDDSAPGPDGYTSAFFKAAWTEIGEEVCAAVKEFFVSGRLLKQINATVLVLIPKLQMPTRVSEFRPIACCNVLYKAISKILVKRMQKVLNSLIDYSQTAFVPGRSITDNIMLAQELLSGYNIARSPKRCTIKIDIQKAYDSVQWDFLLETLKIFKFPHRFVTWMEQCVTTAAFSIALNGQLHGFFKGSKGIRQGDPSSPYLFVLVMELFHVLLQLRVQTEGDFRFHWKCAELGILNLCFADDVLIFCAGDVPSVRRVKVVLEEFAELSGLQVNSSKSTVIFSKAIQSERQELLDLLGFQEGCLPIKYLGVPLTASRLSVADCRPILDKVACRLAGWTHLTLSLAGRAQLLKSVLGSLHTYWYGKGSWDQVCKPQVQGGLGIRRVRHMNLALLLKQVWRILQEDPTSIWVAWVLRYRLRNQPLWTVNASSSSWCWRKLVKTSVLLKEGLEYRVGDGHKFWLWTDLWHPRGPLINHFPRGPSITGLAVDSRLMTVIHQGQWCWPSASDFDIQQIMSDLPAIYPQQPDKVLWKPGTFSTQSLLQFLEPSSPRVLWSQLLGGKFVIPRHEFILWLAILERLSTMDRIWASTLGQQCVLCGGQQKLAIGHIVGSATMEGSTFANAASRALLASAIYNIWRERNNRIFQQVSASAEAVATRALEEVRLRIISANLKSSLQKPGGGKVHGSKRTSKGEARCRMIKDTFFSPSLRFGLGNFKSYVDGPWPNVLGVGPLQN